MPLIQTRTMTAIILSNSKIYLNDWMTQSAKKSASPLTNVDDSTSATSAIASTRRILFQWNRLRSWNLVTTRIPSQSKFRVVDKGKQSKPQELKSQELKSQEPNSQEPKSQEPKSRSVPCPRLRGHACENTALFASKITNRLPKPQYWPRIQRLNFNKSSRAATNKLAALSTSAGKCFRYFSR